MAKGGRRSRRVAKGGSRKLVRRKPSLRGRFLRIFVSRPMRYFFLLVLFLALLFYFSAPLISALENARDSMIETFGLGLVLLALAILLLIWMVWRWQTPRFLSSWNRWLGGIVFLFAISGSSLSSNLEGRAFLLRPPGAEIWARQSLVTLMPLVA